MALTSWKEITCSMNFRKQWPNLPFFSEKEQVISFRRHTDMTWLAWIILGGMAGWISSLLTRNNARMGLFANIAIGIIGAYAGTILLNQFGTEGMTGFNVYSLLVAVLGATLLLWLFNLLRGKR